MAEIIQTVVDFSHVSQNIVFTPATGNDYITLDNADQRVSLIVKNTNASQAATVTLRAGDGALASRGDIAVSAAASSSAVVPMSRAESARVKVLTGSDKGRVLMSSSVDSGGSLAAVQLAVISIL